MTPHRWVMKAVGEPMIREPLELQAPAPGEVLVEVAGCGVCHTDLGFLYDGVRTNQPLPLALGHEISGRVVRAGAGAEAWVGKAVVVPAVIPCGECDACRRGKGTICPTQKMPGNDIHGGFATHVQVPARGLCAVDEARLAKAGLALADVSVVADAVTTPYQAVTQAGVRPGQLVVVNGVGGVGSYCVQIAAALGATVVALDVDPKKLEMVAEQGASKTINVRESRPQEPEEGDRRVREGEGPPLARVDDLRVLRDRRGSGRRLRAPRPRRHPRGGRLHHGQGRGPALEPHGLPRPRPRELGLHAGAVPGRARPRPRRKGRRSCPSSSATPSTRSTASSRTSTPTS